MNRNYEKFYIRRIYGNGKGKILYQSYDYEKIKKIFNTIVRGQGNPLKIKNCKKNDSRLGNTYFLQLEGEAKINVNKCSKLCYDSLDKSLYFPVIKRKFEVCYTEINGFNVKSLEDQNIKVIEQDVHPGLYGCDPPKACVLEANYYEDIDKAFNELRGKRCISWFWIILLK